MVPSALLAVAVVTLAQPAPPRVDRYGDPLPPGAVARYGTVRGQFPNDIELIALSPSGKRTAVCGGRSRSLYVVDTGTGHFIEEIAIEANAFALALAFLTETTVAVTINTNQVSLCELGQKPTPLDSKRLPDMPRHFVRSPDGRHIAISGGDGVRILTYPAFELVAASDTDGTIEQIAFSPDGNWLLGIVPELGVRLWDAKTGKRVRTWTVHAPQRICFAADSKRFFVGARRNLEAYPIDDDSPDPVFEAPIGGVEFFCDLRLTADGKRLRVLSPAEKSRVLEFDATTGGGLVEQQQLQFKSSTVGHWAKLHPDDKSIVGGQRNSLRMWDAKTGQGVEIPEFPPFARSVFLADGKTVRSIEGGNSNTIHEWDATTGRAAGEPKPVTGDVAWGRRYDKYLTRTGETTTIYDFRTRAVLRQLTLELGEKDDLWFHSDEHDWLVVRRKGATEFWDSTTGRLKGRVPVELTDDTSEAFTTDRRKVWVVKEKLAELWEIGSGQQRTTIPFPVHRLTPDPDGRHVWVTVYAENKLIRCDAATGEAGRTFHLPNWDSWIVVSAEGKRIAVYSEREKAAWVLDAETGKRTHEIAAPMHVIQHAAFSPDGTRLVTSGSEGVAYVWDLTRPIPTDKRAEVVPAFRQASEVIAALGKPDAAAVHLALTWLQRHPKEGVAALATAFPPAAAVSEATFAQLLRELDDPEYKTRQRAEKRLEQLGPQAEAALRAELGKERSAEVRSAVERLVARIGITELSADHLRVMRAVEAAERIGTAEAVTLLEVWSKGAEAALLTTEATAALGRVRKAK